ncbi:S-layer homology domain-containing protein [Paenibacillus allorhizosphaerae]|uniref:SLH domain-containing protein n=1 Tax=Paenibacillus allorhizosphaerae TaxID=2849866 RepID=A0ABM8VRM2_9BACL|nr:S-layer homology domain-containing protein [Paenibacillus allorhizosphaerae]CAG7655500.1 hypothetical protein PAECIP111802_06125 [Paenibacillus allorhizosphaerae]
MKKSLSAILSLAMAFSMFSSVALAAEGDNTTTEAGNADATKTSANFSDLKDLDAATKAKFDAMISAGIFDGVKEGTFGLKEKMNRAQFAKVAALIFGLKVDSSLKTSSFTDVKADDPANGYALPYIEAVKAAGITDGYAPGQFNPAGEVTKEQLATFLIRGLKKDKDAQATPGVADKTVSDWAKGYVALAIQLKLLSSGTDGTFGGASAATRDLLVTSAYEAQIQFKNLNKPVKASVSEAKATGVQTVQVKLDRDVDTKKATLTLKKGSSDIATTVKWDSNNSTATLTLTDSKITAGEYSVTLGGLDAKDLDKTVAKFTAENEVLKSIDFLSANDTIAYSDSVVLKLAAKNQYGEKASFSAGGYSVYGVDNARITKADDNTLLLKLNTKQGNYQQGVTIIPITIVNNDQYLTVSKSFKLGTAPILSKLELGEAQYSNTEAKAITSKGESASYELNLFDQYGGMFGYDSSLTEINSNANEWKDIVNVIWNDYVGDSTGKTVIEPTFEDNGNNIPRMKLTLTQNIDKSADYNFTVTTQAATATGKVKVQSAKVATKIEIGDFSDVVAVGDKDVYIPVIAYDAQGNQLSIEDLTSDTNRDRIQITSSFAEPKIMNSGANKGSIHLKNLDGVSKNSAISVTVMIATPNAQSTATRTFTVSDARYPDKIKEVVAPAKQYIQGSSSSFKYVILDQYGKEMKYQSTGVTQDVYMTLEGSSNFKLTKDDDSQEGTALNVSQFNANDEWDPNSYKTFNEGFRIVAGSAANVDDKATLRIEIRKGTQVLTKTEKSLSIVPNNADLNYSVAPLDTMFNTRDSGLSNNVPSGNVSTGGRGAGTALSSAIYNVVYSPLSKEVVLNVTNSSGDKVAIPRNAVSSVSSSDTVSVQTAKDATTGKFYALGYKTGSATVTVNYVNRKGEYKTATVPVTVKNERMKVVSLTAGKSKVLVNAGNTYNISDAYTGTVSKGLMDLKVTDQYGQVFEGTEVVDYNFVYGLAFTANNVSTGSMANPTADDNSVSIDDRGKVRIGANVKAFDLTASAPSGLSVTTQVVTSKE